MYLFSPLTSNYTPQRGPIVIVSYGPAPVCRLLGLDTERISVPFLLERREPRGVPSPCGHSCMACATVCLTVVPSFSDTTDVSAIDHSFKTDRSRTPLFLVLLRYAFFKLDSIRFDTSAKNRDSIRFRFSL